MLQFWSLIKQCVCVAETALKICSVPLGRSSRYDGVSAAVPVSPCPSGDREEDE